MRMNKARTKVLVDRKYNFYNVLGYTFLGGIPFTWLAITQDLFKFGDDAVTVTGWGIVGVGILIVSFWSWIKETVKNYNAYFGNMGKRAKVPLFFGGLSLVLFITYISIQLILGVTLSIAFGGTLSLIPFKYYDMQNEKAKRMTLELIKDNEKTELEELNNLKATIV